ncbi:hypothetical protein GCM10020216_018690 [Nonomuraea helvata]
MTAAGLISAPAGAETVVTSTRLDRSTVSARMNPPSRAAIVAADIRQNRLVKHPKIYVSIHPALFSWIPKYF